MPWKAWVAAVAIAGAAFAAGRADAAPNVAHLNWGPSRVQPPHPGVEDRRRATAVVGRALLCPREIPGLLDDDRRR